MGWGGLPGGGLWSAEGCEGSSRSRAGAFRAVVWGMSADRRCPVSDSLGAPRTGGCGCRAQQGSAGSGARGIDQVRSDYPGYYLPRGKAIARGLRSRGWRATPDGDLAPGGGRIADDPRVSGRRESSAGLRASAGWTSPRLGGLSALGREIPPPARGSRWVGLLSVAVGDTWRRSSRAAVASQVAGVPGLATPTTRRAASARLSTVGMGPAAPSGASPPQPAEAPGYVERSGWRLTKAGGLA